MRYCIPPRYTHIIDHFRYRVDSFWYTPRLMGTLACLPPVAKDGTSFVCFAKRLWEGLEANIRDYNIIG